jgi:hypothetical protein
MKDMVGGSSVWWYSIPGVSSFKIDFSKGQLAIVRLMRRLKYKEILQSELEKKRLSVTQLPIEYHVLYLIGCELITRYVMMTVTLCLQLSVTFHCC